MPTPYNKDYFLNNFNTKLPPEAEKRFDGWLQKESEKRGKDMSNDLYDYDLRGFFLENSESDTGTGHMTDRYKKPSHPTFSNESKYHGTPSEFGKWEGGQWGYGKREPSQSEATWFEQNPHIAGRADPKTNSIVLNPYSPLSDEQKQAVFKNESARLTMWNKKLTPGFKLTEKQKEAFKNYGDIQSIRETIVGRIVSGDTSALDVTKEQKEFAKKVLAQMGNRFKPSKTMLETTHRKDWLQNYMKQNEPDVDLVLE